MTEMDDLFERRYSYPDASAQRRYASLVGVDEIKARLVKALSTCINPGDLAQWSEEHHGKAGRALLELVLHRPPLVILAGDVGTGKTALAESVGDILARQENIPITMFPVSLSTRGIGRVGEMTKLISSAFEIALQEAEKSSVNGGRPSGAVLLLIDEADALAQSREFSQMHHEDKAGVNAFIRGVDRVANAGVPMGILMCTNRMAVIDPAIRRRASEVLIFSRPNMEQRQAALLPFCGVGFTEDQISEIAEATGKHNGKVGFTYSDLTQRLIPAIVLDAYPERSIQFERAIEIAKSMRATPQFNEQGDQSDEQGNPH